MKSGKQIFRPKARIIKSLGDELISNEYVAVSELIKNSYDANATFVDIQLLKDKIIIKDNGDGMTLEQLRTGWFEPATDIKVGKKKVLGEKGIGRFATVKLANKLNLKTKAIDHNCINCDFDWGIFNENKDSYLDEINILWKEENNNNLKIKGTILTLSELKDNWLEENRIKELKIFLSRMINPFEEVSDFKIKLIIDNKIIEILPSEVLKHPHYEVIGNYNDGIINFSYRGLSKKDEKNSFNIKNNSLFHCGNFSFIFKIWDRDTNDITELSKNISLSKEQIKEDLNKAAGISIYRDKFRVLPYGENNNDWLRLDIRRVQNPTLRLSNNQIIGYLSISKKDNKDLKDKTNREGLVENIYYYNFVEIVRDYILKKIEEKRYIERIPKRKEINERKPNQLLKEFNLKEVQEYAEKKYPDDKVLVDKITKKEKEIIEQGKEFQKLIIRYRRLSTLGQLLENVIHELKNSFAGLSTNISIIESYSKDNLKVIDSIRAIRDGQKSISQFVNRLKPFAERSNDKKGVLNIKEEIKNIIEIKKSELEKNNIKISLPKDDLKIAMRGADIFSVISNLIDNSIYWLVEENDIDDRHIYIKFESKDNDKIIIFGDNGPNVPTEYKERIFDPYFSLKKNGTGLGLSIIGEIISEYDGSFDFIEDKNYQGATFKITL